MVKIFMQNFSTESGGSAPKKLNLKSLGRSLKGAGNEVRLPFQKEKVYDVVVIGGGTGGLSFV